MSDPHEDVANHQSVVEAVNPQRRLPFQRAGLLSVASGDPSSHGVVLWTRLAPDPLHSSGGMDDRYLQNAHAASFLS